MNKFSELALTPVLRGNLARHGFETPTPVQAEAIPAAMEGRDVIATAQTGTGKTLAFVLPMLKLLSETKERSGIQAVILTPTRELALQIDETLVKLAAGTGIRSAVVVGGMSEHTQLRAIRGGARVIVATPGRLADYLERKLVDLGKVRMFVLDEADRMLDMGFLPVLRRILGELPASRQTLLFSATIERSVAHLIHDYVNNPVRIAIGETTQTARNIDFDVYEVDQDRKLALLTDLIGRDSGSFLVFTRTKHRTDRLAASLAEAGVRAARIHGNRTQAQRNQALQGFRKGQYRVLVATDVAARGIHVDGIAHVVNYDLPQVTEDFIHRVGRTARAGARGTASTFTTPSERSSVRRMEKDLGITFSRKSSGNEGQDSKLVTLRKAAPRPAAGHRRRAGR